MFAMLGNVKESFQKSLYTDVGADYFKNLNRSSFSTDTPLNIFVKIWSVVFMWSFQQTDTQTVSKTKSMVVSYRIVKGQGFVSPVGTDL